MIDPTITSARVIPRAPEHVYAFLADLANHWHLNDPHLRLVDVCASGLGGRFVIRGPLGLRRAAHTTVTTRRAPYELSGIATIGRRTRAHAGWRIEPAPEGSHVVLESTAARIGTLDRFLLTIGRWWLRRSFDRILTRLHDQLAATPTPTTTACARDPDEAGKQRGRCGARAERREQPRAALASRDQPQPATSAMTCTKFPGPVTGWNPSNLG